MYALILLILTLACYSTCQRRIVDGETIDRPYVVYMVWDEWDNVTRHRYSDFNTLCGGFLLTATHIVTSAVCLRWHPVQYVVAGYNRYVPHGRGRNDEEKECLAIAKRFVTQYTLIDDKTRLTSDWYYADMGIGTLEAPYDFNDDSFETKCSYKPTAAKLLPEEGKLGDNVILMGWGSSKYHPPEHHEVDMNEEYLRATATVVSDMDECTDLYNLPVKQQLGLFGFRFCTDGEASIDHEGKLKETYRRHLPNNGTEDQCLFALNAENVYNNKKVTCLNTFRRGFRRLGACQNDHGGPVVKYVNLEEYVIGIITAYLVNSNLECVGPTVCTRFEKRHIEALRKYAKFSNE